MTMHDRGRLAVRSLLVAAAILSAGSAPDAIGQQPTGDSAARTAPPRLSEAERAAALEAVKAALQKSYVFPEMRGKLVARLTQAEERGRYRRDDPYALADRITQDLRDVSRDGHLSFRFAPAEYSAAKAPAAAEEGSEAVARREALRRHHGLRELRILPGNVRYLRITGFHWVSDESGAAYDDALRFLKDGDAVIVDLRGNGGGSAEAVQYLTSHFVDADTLLLTFLHGTRTPVQSRALSHLPAGRLKGKPLYVLIDGGVASAAEEFSYHVQHFKLGELVGARTAGAANNNELLPIEPGFILSISVGRPVHPVSKTNWEGTGIEPTVPADPAKALDVAHSLALTRLAQAPGGTPETLAEYAWARTGVAARLSPVSLPPTQLRRFAGAYGDVSVEFRDGALWLARPHRPTRRLAPLTPDGLFAVEDLDVMRVRFTPKGLELLWEGEAVPRVFLRS
jgi:hypothetical protein